MIDIMTDIFRMAESHDVTIGFGYSKDFRCFTLEVRRGDIYTKRYIRTSDFRNTVFVFDLIRDMIDAVEKEEKKQKERKDV